MAALPLVHGRQEDSDVDCGEMPELPAQGAIAAAEISWISDIKIRCGVKFLGFHGHAMERIQAWATAQRTSRSTPRPSA